MAMSASEAERVLSTRIAELLRDTLCIHESSALMAHVNVHLYHFFLAMLCVVLNRVVHSFLCHPGSLFFSLFLIYVICVLFLLYFVIIVVIVVVVVHSIFLSGHRFIVVIILHRS